MDDGGRVLTVPLLVLLLVSLAGSSPPPAPVVCAHGTSDCTVSNAYGSFPDRTVCHAANATFPRTEKELVAAVAAVAAAKRKVKVATKHSHSFPKLACPGGRDGTIISTERLNRVVSVDAVKGLMTVESGMVLRDLIQAAAEAGLALPHSPYWSGLTIGGLLATGAHGSSLKGKGGAVHEYVVGMRIVTPAPASQGFAVVRELCADHPDLNAAKVSLGVLGVVSQVTLALQPMFKRSVTFVTRDDLDIAEQASKWSDLHEFGDMAWLPQQGKVIYREDDRMSIELMGDGLNDYLAFRSTPTAVLINARVAMEPLEKNINAIARCKAAEATISLFEMAAYGYSNNGSLFTGYPVVGFQHQIQASSGCIGSSKDALLTSCAWDPRIEGTFFYSNGYSIALSRVSAFIADMQQLRDRSPLAFCGIDASVGMLLRYVKASSAYLGKPEDSIDFDIAYYRSYTKGEPNPHSDVFDELEQMALHKYDAIPHWGKNRNFAFEGAIAMYPKAGEFLEVKGRYDPDGIFSSKWSDQVLGINGSPVIVERRCAIEGLCICSEDSHCAPEEGYYCRPGKMDLSPCEQFLLEDSSSSDNSDVESMLERHRQQMVVVVLAVKEEEDQNLKRRRGSTVGRLCIPRNRHLRSMMLMQDYFADNPTYPLHFFRRRRNAAGLLGFSTYQKISAAMRLIAYGILADYADEYLRIDEDTTFESVRRFAKVMIRVFGHVYLRAPNKEDTIKLMAANEKRVWPDMLGSIGCMHWTWKNCPKAWHGQFCGKSRKATIVLEVVASEDLWIWHCFLEYTKGYYLADEHQKPKTKWHTEFAKVQEATQKDIERAFEILQTRFAIVRGPACFWDKKTLSNILICCVILHNMIIEDERDLNLEFFTTMSVAV
uniref:L-gulonolactone oxidase n=1 Tax=Aegilops tauschii TaxID=37682 RepID=R7WBQ9_AEGTA